MTLETPKQAADFQKVIEQIGYVIRNKKAFPFGGLKLDGFTMDMRDEGDYRDIYTTLPDGGVISLYQPKLGWFLSIAYYPPHWSNDKNYTQIRYKVAYEAWQNHTIGDVMLYRKGFGNHINWFETSSNNDYFELGNRGKAEYTDMTTLDRISQSFLQVTELLRKHLLSKWNELATALES